MPRASTSPLPTACPQPKTVKQTQITSSPSALWRKLIGITQVGYCSSFTRLPQISLFLFASKPPLNRICLVAYKSFPMTNMQICLLFLGKNLSYVSSQQIPIPQPPLCISPCFVCLSSDSSCVFFVIMPLCLRTNIIRSEQGKDAGRTL